MHLAPGLATPRPLSGKTGALESVIRGTVHGREIFPAAARTRSASPVARFG
jgi:hypothetical protein